MDRDALDDILTDLADGTLSVKPDGTVCTSGGGEWPAAAVAAIAADTLTGLERLTRVLAWAQAAPEYTAAGELTTQLEG